MIEDIIRKILSEELQKTKVEIIDELRGIQENISLTEQYGETLTVDQVSLILKISKSKVYEMARGSKFPCKRAGSKIIIPTRQFFSWLNDDTTKD